MISDSTPWKDELLKIANRLEAKRKLKRWTERSSFLVERDVMVSAYAIRKLLEAYKVSDALRDREVSVDQFTLIGTAPPNWLNRFEFWEFYDMDKPTRQMLSLREMCNQIIHSWMWVISGDDQAEPFDGFLVASDRERRKRLFYVDATTFIELCREIGNEDVYSKRWVQASDGSVSFLEILGRPYEPPEEPDLAPA